MKTEPTINIQSEVAKIHSQYGTTEMANYRIEKLFEMYVKQSSPKIKQLEWVYDKSDEIYIAKLSMFEYRIWQDNNQSFMKVMINNNHCTIMRCITIDEAKSAAQADFEKRVKECLE